MGIAFSGRLPPARGDWFMYPPSRSRPRQVRQPDRRFPGRTPGLLLCLALQSCSGIPGPDCHPPAQTAVLDSLYFGTAKPAGMVSQTDWTGFLEQVVTPGFPQGLTTWEVFGQWRTTEGSLHKESSHLLQLVHPDTPEAEGAVIELMQRYKTEFQQEAVLRVRSEVCVSF